MGLKDLAGMIAEKKGDDVLFEEAFLESYNKTLIEDEAKRQQAVPTDYFRPSSLGGGCKRMLWYQRKGMPKDAEERSPILIGICDSGTDRHARIQDIVAKMEGVVTLDIEDVVKEAKQAGVNSEFVGWNSDHTEARCKNDDLSIFFQADGAFKFMGRECLLEIKTINSFGFKKLNAPKPEHLRQATCYAMGLNMKWVLFFYEDRNFTDHKLFLVEITDELKEEIRNKVDDVNNYIAENKLPPKEEDKCQYCLYKELCGKDGDNDFTCGVVDQAE